MRFKSSWARLCNDIAVQCSQDGGRSRQRNAGAGEDVAGGGVLSDTVKVVGFQGGSEGEAEQPILSVGGVASKPLASKHD